MRIACSTWDGGGNVIVFRALVERLRARGHDVSLQVDFKKAPSLDGDVVLVDHMTSPEGLALVRDSGRPHAAIVHTMWSFVPSLDGTFYEVGYVDALASLQRALVFSVQSLDGAASAPPNVRWVGPVLEPEGRDTFTPPDRSLVVVSLGTTDMGETPVLQRVLDALAAEPVSVIATVGDHVERRALRPPKNARITGFVRHTALLPHADVFVGHGGHGGIMAALAFGVPVVTIPLDRDQPHNAARVEAVGAGRTVAKDATADAIRDAVESVRTGIREREGAIRMANAVAEYRDAAVEAVESLGR